MKILVLAIDGLGAQSARALGLPRLHARLARAQAANPFVAHRVSRGWPEIYAGRTAWETGGFYQVPQMKGGRIRATQSTGAPCVERHVGREAMLWHRLAAQGHKVGVFTLPTVTETYPTEGYVIAATGGGKFGSGLSADALSPPDLLDNARIKGVDLGLRTGYGAFLPRDLADLETTYVKHLSDYFFTLGIAMERRPCDVHIVGTRFVTELAYKFIHLLEHGAAGSGQAGTGQAGTGQAGTGQAGTKAEAERQRDLVLALADRFDLMLDRFVEACGARHVFVVSDHGIGPFEKEFNLNEALADLDWIARDPMRDRAKAGALALRRMRVRTRGGAPVNPEITHSYRFEAARAFSPGYMDAIYLNDDRFTGPAMDEAARFETASALAETLNRAMADRYGEPGIRFEAVKGRGVLPQAGAKGAPVACPDIVVEAPPGYVNEKKTGGFIGPRDIYFGRALYTRGFPGEFSGTKTRDTISAYAGPAPERVRQERLTDLYHAILAVAEHET